jgi:uncharacterized membrane protein
MSHTTAAVLTGVLIFAAAIWVGGLVAIAIVARVARSTLDPAGRVAFFRGLGRSYVVVGTAALAVAYGTGAVLVHGRDWNGELTAVAAIAAALALTLAVGIAQARRMTQLRRHALDHPEDGDVAAQVRRGAGRAGALRGVIALFSLALICLGVLIGS